MNQQRTPFILLKFNQFLQYLPCLKKLLFLTGYILTVGNTLHDVNKWDAPTKNKFDFYQ